MGEVTEFALPWIGELLAIPTTLGPRCSPKIILPPFPLLTHTRQPAMLLLAYLIDCCAIVQLYYIRVAVDGTCLIDAFDRFAALIPSLGTEKLL